jgi:lipoyl(octanoyl) transferase
LRELLILNEEWAHINEYDAFWLGQMEYEVAWKLQDRLAAEIAAGRRRPVLLLLEHPHTYTLGRRARKEHVLWSADECAQRGIRLYNVDRGGDVTYHGPGQLVGYPLLPLAAPGWSGERLPQADFVGYVRALEKALIFALARFGLVAGQREGLTGVWIAEDVMNKCRLCDPKLKPIPGKIASIGVKVDTRGISRHGFALNVNTDPDFWAGIVPCGIDQVRMVDLVDFLEEAPPAGAVRDAVLAAFEEVFQCRLQRYEGQAVLEMLA